MNKMRIAREPGRKKVRLRNEVNDNAIAGMSRKSPSTYEQTAAASRPNVAADLNVGEGAVFSSVKEENPIPARAANRN